MRPGVSIISLLAVLLTFGISGALAVSPSEPWHDWKEAKIRYDAHQWAEAVAELQKNPHLTDFAYYYNLGATYLQLGHPGLALAHLEKANHLHPHHPDIQANLNLARRGFAEQVGSNKLDPASSWIEQIADQVSFDEVRSTLAFLVLGVTLILARNFGKTKSISASLLHPASYLGSFALLITFGMYLIRLWASAHPCGILSDHQAIRSGPGEHFQLLEEGSAGEKLRLLGSASISNEDHEVWRQVRFSSDGIGWVKEKSLFIL